MINRGRTPDLRSFGNGLEDKKLLLEEGVVDEELKSFLYVERFELVLSGDVWGELYSARSRRPKENMSADDEMLLSSAKSGDV